MLERVWRKGDAPTLSVGMEIGKPLCRTVWTFLKKLKTGLWRDSAIPLLGIHPPGENHEPEGYVHPTVHCGTVYNSQDVEATYVSINRRTDKEHVVHLHKGKLYSREKEHAFSKRNNIDESYRHSWMKEYSHKRVELNDLLYMKFRRGNTNPWW